MTNVSMTALVPIKGESERLPGKNIRNFCGQPLLYRVIEMLQQCTSIDRIIVNTDSNLVSELALNWSKVRIHERPTALCGHHIPMNSIISHDISILGEGHYLQTHVTNPLLRKETVTSAVAHYFSSIDTYDSLFTVRKLQKRFWCTDGTPLNHNPKHLLNTQDLEPIYEENSCLYIFSSKSFQNSGNSRIGLSPQLLPISQCESLDIDEEDDFCLAELAWKTFRQLNEKMQPIITK